MTTVVKDIEKSIKDEIATLLHEAGHKISKYNIDSIYENHLYDSKNRDFATLIKVYSKELK